MAARNEMKGVSVRGRKAARKRVAGETGRPGQQKKKITAMVPARFFSGTPEYAKGVVGRWGKTICFEDQSFFLL